MTTQVVGIISLEKGGAPMQDQKSSFLSELLLYSGQYALFYILMNFSKSGMAMFQYKAHTILLLGLILQTFVLSRYGSNVKYRILGSLICPIIYTFVEIEEFKDFILNIGHFFFWGFSLSIGILNAAKLKFKKSIRSILEFVTVFTNVIVFVFIYMYFDLMLSISTETNAGIVEYHHYLSVLNLPGAISDFIGDQAHIYITLGGIILGISLGLSQLRVLQLKERINDLFGKYIDASIRDRIIANNGYIEEKQELCILFSDIRNFTNISESASSEKLIKALNAYFSLWESEVSKHDGIINKYIGDAVMVIFGLEDPECKETHAVSCALDVLDALDRLNRDLKDKNLPEFSKIGIGIHSGELIVGNVGSDNRKEFTVIGDVVNTASRLESHTKETLQDLIISEAVYSRAHADIQKKFTYLDSIALKGKSIQVDVYTTNAASN